MKLGKSGNKTNNKKLTTLALYAFLAFIAFTIADLTIIYFRDRLIPDQPPPKKTNVQRSRGFADRSQYSVISNRNLFSSNGIMPTAITSAGNKEDEKKENTPVPSQLPITIIGTLVHSDPLKSIAALDLKTKNKTGSYTVGSDVDGLCRIEKVERNIVYIRNNSNGMLEYIEMSKGSKINFDASKPSAPVRGNKDVVVSGSNQFTISRANLLKYTNDLSSVLMQARAVPNRDPVTGEINGFRVLDYQPGSIYEQLGLQRMDVIKGVNGEPVDSIQKAMEMYNTLKNGTQVKMQIERSGKTDTFTYDIK
jgi:general secretion pathway protein C